MKQKFVERKFRGDSARKIEIADAIITDYQSQGLRLTLRQLYYVFVTRNEIENSQRSYKNLASLISDARLAGLLDWDAIEDRGRMPHTMASWSNISERLQMAIKNYRRDRWTGQTRYVELWVEKDALAGVLEPVAQAYHVTLMVNKGYSSQSAMYEAAQRFSESERLPVLLYLGDHDPSGEDMVRDIRERLTLFGVQQLEMHKVALTTEQVEEHELPPNPAKKSDARYERYAAVHGDESWELDALEPKLLQSLVRDALDRVVAPQAMNAVRYMEQIERNFVAAFTERLPKGIEADLKHVSASVAAIAQTVGKSLVAVGVYQSSQGVERKLLVVTRSEDFKVHRLGTCAVTTIVANKRPDIDGVFWLNLLET